MSKLKEKREFFKQCQKRTKKYKTDKDGRAVIDIGAENYEDIFSYYSLDGVSVLDDECAKFVESRADLISMSEDLTLRFHVQEASDKKRREIDYAVRENYLKELDKISKELKEKSLLSLIMLLFGGAFFVLYYFSHVLNFHIGIQFLTEIISWVFIWEAVNSFFLQRQNLKAERLKQYRLIYSKIEVKEYDEKFVVEANEEMKKAKIKNKIEKLRNRLKIKKEKLGK